MPRRVQSVSSPSQFQAYRARRLVPITRPVIEDGILVVQDGRIAAVERTRNLTPHLAGKPVDLGETTLFPGLVNAHCHLDYTRMAGQVARVPSFTDWIKSMTATKSTWSRADFEASWRAGAGMLVAGGVTTVGDIETLVDLVPSMWDTTPLRVTSFLEMTGVRSRIDPTAILADAVARVDALAHPRSRAALSPHAPYSTVPALVTEAAAAATARGQPFSIHVAESIEEEAMFREARGPMYDWIARNQRDMSDCGNTTPVRQLHRCGTLGPNLLAIHCNYLDADDVDLLARHHVHVVHCPRSHAYFGHRPFPYSSLARAGVNVCLGTDSLVTVLQPSAGELGLNLLAEVRAFLASAPATAPEVALRMTTVNGARALGLAGTVGELTANAFADCVATPASDSSRSAIESFLYEPPKRLGVMIGGQWVLNRPGT